MADNIHAYSVTKEMNQTVTTVVTHREKSSTRTWRDRDRSQVQKAGSLWKTTKHHQTLAAVNLIYISGNQKKNFWKINLPSCRKEKQNL